MLTCPEAVGPPMAVYLLYVDGVGAEDSDPEPRRSQRVRYKSDYYIE